MPDRKKRAERRAQQDREIEHSQAALRASIAETCRLVDQSDEMIARHRRERDLDDADDEPEDSLAGPRPPLSG
jgi:hypothetical protein